VLLFEGSALQRFPSGMELFVNPHHVDADPDLAFHLMLIANPDRSDLASFSYADPDPAFFSFTDPDPAFYF
jgi:hypothetical protein